jgi:HAD superfamily phosphatase (TIGR01668 family)
MGRAFRKALKLMNVSREQVVVIGDQMMTDIFGGNLNKLHTILVLPVAQSDGFFTRFNRLMERRIMKKLKEKGQLTWEEEN